MNLFFSQFKEEKNMIVSSPSESAKKMMYNCLGKWVILIF